MTIDGRLTVTISAPKEHNLSEPQREFLRALEQRVQKNGMRLVNRSANDAETEFANTRRCHGMIVLAFSQWDAQRLHRAQRTVTMPSEFNHMMATMAVAAGRPLLVLREKTLADRGVLRPGYLSHVVKLPRHLKTDWFEEDDFKTQFKLWLQEVESFRHVFLGYSSQAKIVGDKIRQFISRDLGLRVFDWHNFQSGVAIGESIQRAERLTDCGIFLFMADDKLTSAGREESAPRDNVIYEAGYFSGAKGFKNSLIVKEVKEDDVKIPTDLGGIKFVKLESREDISTIKTPIRDYLQGICETDQ